MLRRQFVGALRSREPAAVATARLLLGTGIKEAAQSLGARLVRRAADAPGLGCLRRDGAGWVVEVKDDPDDLSGHGRRVVAHELAHLLLINQGMPSPCSIEEYWMLEDACDRMAMRLQVPRQDHED